MTAAPMVPQRRRTDTPPVPPAVLQDALTGLARAAVHHDDSDLLTIDAILAVALPHLTLTQRHLLFHDVKDQVAALDDPAIGTEDDLARAVAQHNLDAAFQQAGVQ